MIERVLFLDLETNLKGNCISKAGLCIESLNGGTAWSWTEAQPKPLLQSRLDDALFVAAAISGHNIWRHDLPVLAKLFPKLALLEKLPVVDTLELSPLCFPRNPYHALEKDYKPTGREENDPLGEHPTEVAHRCAACGHTEYPGVFVAVIVRVEKDGKILLARHVQRSQEFFTCLAGYVEVGESLEDCVRREVREEAGIEVADVRYVCSQHWPYPNQLMLAFKARWAAGELKLQADELAEARWFDPADLPNIPPEGSVAYRLIRGLI